MRTRALAGTAPLWAAAAVVLVAPFFAAFRSGGFFPKTQLLIGIAAFATLAVVALTAPWPPLPGRLPLAALGALVGYAVWTGFSIGWARVVDIAVRDTDRVAMYCAVFALALAVTRVPVIGRIAPEVLLAGILVVCLYALAGRLLPHAVHQHSSSVRLSQPLTYWNALGMLAGFGVVLGVAVAGDEARPRLWRACACAAAVLCGLAAFLTLSRGVAASVLAGLVVCVLLRRERSTLLAAGCAVAAVVALAVALIGFDEILSVHGDVSAQASQGLAFLPIALAATLAAGLAFARLSRTRLARRQLQLNRRLRAGLALAAVPVVLGIAVAVAGNGKEQTEVTSRASRITRVETNRGHYWQVAFDAFTRHPLNGIGSGSFTAEWYRHRGKDKPALDAHSIYVETLGELGVVGAGLLLAFFVAVALGTARAARAARRDPTVAAAAGVLAAFAVHVGLDWDWEMPAVSLVALILAALVLQPRRTGASDRAA